MGSHSDCLSVRFISDGGEQNPTTAPSWEARGLHYVAYGQAAPATNLTNVATDDVTFASTVVTVDTNQVEEAAETPVNEFKALLNILHGQQ